MAFPVSLFSASLVVEEKDPASGLTGLYRGFARQPCCMAGRIKMFCMRKNICSDRKKNQLFLPCNMAAVQNLYTDSNICLICMALVSALWWFATSHTVFSCSCNWSNMVLHASVVSCFRIEPLVLRVINTNHWTEKQATREWCAEVEGYQFMPEKRSPDHVC